MYGKLFPWFKVYFDDVVLGRHFVAAGFCASNHHFTIPKKLDDAVARTMRGNLETGRRRDYPALSCFIPHLVYPINWPPL